MSNQGEKLKNAAKNEAKRQIKKIVIKVLMTVLPYLLIFLVCVMLALMVYAVFDAVTDKIGSLLNQAAEYTSNVIIKITNNYWIDLEEKRAFKNEDGTLTEEKTLVDEYIDELDKLGVSLEALRLLGDIDYSDSQVVNSEENKDIKQKYIHSFVVGDLVSSQIRRRGGTGTINLEIVEAQHQRGDRRKQIEETRKVDGCIKLYKAIENHTSSSNAESEYDVSTNKMEYKTIDEFNKLIDKFNSSDDPDAGNNHSVEILKRIFAIDDEGNLLVPEITQYTVEEDGEITQEKYSAEIKKIDYRNDPILSQFMLPYEFLVDLCMVTQNPEFVTGVAVTSVDSEMKVIVTDNSTIEIIKTKYKDATTNEEIEKVETKTTTNPEIHLEYANTWNRYQKNTWKNIVTNTQSGNKTIITNSYSCIEGSLVKKSDIFLGLLINSTGEYDENATFNRYGINVKYKIPNVSTREEAVLNLVSGEEMLYSLMEKNERTAALIEDIKYFLTFPEQEYYDLTDEEIKNILGVNLDNLDEIKNINTTENQKETAKKIYDFLIGKGFTSEATCGILGNMQQESSLNTSASNGSHFGLCQWGGGRFEALKNLAKDKGKTWTNLDVQLEFLWNELCSSEKTTKDALTDCNSLLDATSSFCKLYERCGNYDKEISKRYGYAKYWYTELVGKIDSDSDSDSNYDGTYTAKSGKSYKLYRQNYYTNIQYGDGTIASQGCNITSVAITLSAYGCDKNPAQLINGGTSSLVSTEGLLRQNGLDVTRVYGFNDNTIQIIKENLEEGRPVVFNVNSNSSYTSNQHWMTLADIRTQNGFTEVYVLNPNKAGQEGWNLISNVINRNSLKSYIIVNE